MRVCMRCKVGLPLALYPMIGAYHSRACPTCFEPRPIEQDDHRPAVRMRAALARRRRQGLGWDDDTFNQLAETVLAGLRPQDAEGWASIFHAHRAAWEAAYTRSEAVTTLTVEVLD